MTTDKTSILSQIKQEYMLWFDYVKDKRQQYRDRIAKFWNQWKKKKDKISVNMIANYIDTLIASSWVDWLKTKFISKDWWIGQEEADNMTKVFKFDMNEQDYQQLLYQIEQDSFFFGVWILAYLGFDSTKRAPKFRAINPLSWIPDPMPTQTGLFNGQNYRFHWFAMTTNVYDLRRNSGVSIDEINSWISFMYSDEKNKDRQAYEDKNNYWRAATLQTLQHNMSIDVYYHYTTIGWKKYMIMCDMWFSHIFAQEEIKAVLKEELLDSDCIWRPIALNYYDPERENPFWKSVCDKIEDKQNAKNILLNLSVIEAKKQVLWGTMIVNSRLIKDKKALTEPSVDTKLVFTDENIADETQISNALYELPKTPIWQDTYAIIQALEREARDDTSIDSLQAWVTPDKSMTKAEAQQIQANANMKLAVKSGIKWWFYKELAFMWWRSYQENFKAWQKKFIVLNEDFEWRTVSLSRDDMYTRWIPTIIVWSAADIEAINEKHKQYMNMQLPIILQDPDTPSVSKLFAKRLTYKLNWLSNNEVNILCPLTPDERKAQDYVFMVNQEILPKSLLSNPWIDLFTVYIYMQKAQDNEIKDKVLYVLEQMLIDRWMDKSTSNVWWAANTSANIQMAQIAQQQWQQLVTRDNLQTNTQ